MRVVQVPFRIPLWRNGIRYYVAAWAFQAEHTHKREMQSLIQTQRHNATSKTSARKTSILISAKRKSIFDKGCVWVWSCSR